MAIQDYVRVFSDGRAVRTATLHRPWFAADRPPPPVASFAGMLLTHMLARHRRIKGVTLIRLTDSLPRRARSPLLHPVASCGGRSGG